MLYNFFEFQQEQNEQFVRIEPLDVKSEIKSEQNFDFDDQIEEDTVSPLR